MSKKNKNKRKFTGGATSAEGSAEKASTEAVETKVQTKQSDDDIKKEFTRLAFVIIFILALLVAIYFYNNQTHILQTFTHRLFGMF